MTINAVGDVSCTIQDPSEKISSVTGEQTAGVGGSGGDYQMTSSLQYPQSLLTGFFINRFISNYNVGTDTKSGILTEFGLGGWNIGPTVATGAAVPEEVQFLEGAGEINILSNDNLTAGTTYNSLHFWIGDTYASDFINAANATAAQTALDNADGIGELFPSGDAVVASTSVTISGTTTPATDITFTGGVVENSGAGTFIGTATSDRSNGTWSLVNSPPAWIDLSSSTALQATFTVAAGQTAPSAGDVTFDVRYDNSGVTGGGTFTETQTVTVSADTGGSTARYLPVPAVNVNSSGQDLTISELKTLLANLESSWASTMTSLGLATTGVDPVLELAATNFNADLVMNGYGPYSDGSNTRTVHVRGQGTFSRDDWTATTTGTRVRRLAAQNCENLECWLIYAEDPSTAYPHHQIVNCNEVYFKRCALHGDVARNASDAANRPNIFGPLMAFYGSQNSGIIQCTVVGGGPNYLNAYSDNGNTDNITIKQCVFDQFVSDMISMGNNNVNHRWQIVDNYWGGRVRRQSNVHPDMIQFANGSAGINWNVEGNFAGTTGWWGYKGNPSNKIQQANNGAAKLQATFFDNFNVTPTYAVDGNGSKHNLGSATYNTVLHTPALLLADESGEQGAINVRGAVRAGIGTTDFNLFVRKDNPVSQNGQGPNDLYIISSGFVPADEAGYDWSDMAAYWEDYSVPANPVANVNDIVPNHRTSSIAGFKPKTGTRMHWDHANPAGAYRWLERQFDPVTHDNFYDWGWPTACQGRIAYDSGGGLAGATLANSFDANGD